jgi:hypothetical protein
MASSACCSHRLSTRGFLRQSMDRVPLGTTNRLTRARVVSGKDSHSSRQHGFVKPIRALRLRRRSVSDDSASTTWVLPEEARARGMRVDTLLVLETNVDDLSPQIVAYAFEELLAAGALDVWSVPVTMKKGRMGTLLCALCDREHAERLCAIIFKVCNEGIHPLEALQAFCVVNDPSLKTLTLFSFSPLFRKPRAWASASSLASAFPSTDRSSRSRLVGQGQKFT